MHTVKLPPTPFFSIRSKASAKIRHILFADTEKSVETDSLLLA